jgi:hypothetical protein
MIINVRLWVASISVAIFFAGSASALELSPAVATQAWTWYKTMLVQHPLLTKSVTSSCIMTFSDGICQKLTMGAQDSENDRKKRLDFGRMTQVAITGLTWSGPITHTWYGLLEQIVKIQDPMLGLFARIFLDAIIFSPVTVTGYFIWRSMLEGSGLRGASHKLRTRFSSTVLGAWKFWPAANIINFGMIPLEYRALYQRAECLLDGIVDHCEREFKTCY